MVSANIPMRFVLKIVFVSLYITSSQYHNCANLSEGIELIKCLSNIFCRVCKIRHIISIIHYTIRGAVCFQFTHTLSYYHHQIGSMNYYPLFRVRSWNNGVRCMSFCILIVTLFDKMLHWLCEQQRIYMSICYARFDNIVYCILSSIIPRYNDTDSGVRSVGLVQSSNYLHLADQMQMVNKCKREQKQ